jgi:hypothetical protein
LAERSVQTGLSASPKTSFRKKDVLYEFEKALNGIDELIES